MVVAISVVVIGAAIVFVSSGYLATRRADRKADDVRAAVHAMTMQELAAAIARCDASADPRTTPGGAVRRDTAYCETVARELDARPLEIVNVKPAAKPAAVP